jgi:fatty aldehyde-generating acyl-ACP reductase
LEKFAFIIHPLEAKPDIARKFPIAKYLPESVLELVLKQMKPLLVSHITGVKSLTGAEAEGWFIGCPLSAHQMMTLPTDYVLGKIINCAKVAQDVGAKIVGLGAFTSVVGDGGITIAKNVDIAVTSGNSFTIATGLQGAMEAAQMMDISLPDAKVAVVGAAGSIGRTCARILARRVSRINIIDLDAQALEKVAEEVRAESNVIVTTSADVHEGIKDADIVCSATSAVKAIIQPADLMPGCVVCDVARPRDVSTRVSKERDDVLVIDGGMVAVPGADLDFHFNFGFPPKTAYACMSETMMLALEGRYESFTLGKQISVEQVEEITRLSEKHGFKLAGFRSFEREVTHEQIERVKANARRNKAVV